jgi:hypothetical protein
MDFNTQVKLNIYKTIAETTRAPTSDEVAVALNASVEVVEDAFKELASERLLVLEDDTNSHIRMAPPFSGIATPFRVDIGSKFYYANCVWDALGIAAALHSDGDVTTNCADCSQTMTVQILGGQPAPQDCAIHFAVPAARWWDDIIYT